jgi:hypothetical protein
MRKVDPPDAKAVMGRWSYDYLQVAKELHESPGEWHLLDEGAKLSAASAIRQGSIKDFHPKDGYEVTTRNTDRKVNPPTCDIYVRWVQPEKKEN